MLPHDQIPKGPLTVEQFLAWCETVPGRFELEQGEVVVMQAERVIHARVKSAVQAALGAAIKHGHMGSSCEALPDGLKVRTSKTSSFEPDALVHCGPRLEDDAVEVMAPVIVVEVTSPSTALRDETVKVAGYFSVPSVHHYLIVVPKDRMVIHFGRQSADTWLTRIGVKGALRLDPPGITVDVDSFFPPV